VLYDLADALAGVDRLPLSSITSAHELRYPSVEIAWLCDPRLVAIGELSAHELATLSAIITLGRGRIRHVLPDGTSLGAAQRTPMREYLDARPELLDALAGPLNGEVEPR